MPDRTRARELAAESLRAGDPTGWFDRLYREAEEGKSAVPWDDRAPHPGLLDFWKSHPRDTAGKSAIVVGSGLGDDAEFLLRCGFAVTAFDISPAAIRATRARFPQTRVDYIVADLFSPPASWNRKFDFVFEANTLQALPSDIRPAAFGAVAAFVAPGGSLLVIARGREASEPEGQLPWPLTGAEFEAFIRAGLVEQSFEEYLDSEQPPSRRFRVLYRRPPA
jgi:ubiquinone/menaquinone biosynthesis C-methylase UbiE